MTKQPDTPLAGLAALTKQPAPPVPLDSVDLALLRLLAQDARSSQRSLGRELGMSPSAIGERIARLERSGVIRGYSVVLDWDAAGFPVVVYLAITAAQGFDLGPVMTQVNEIPEVEDVMVVTGELDLLARVRVRDYVHLRSLLMDKVWQIQGIQRTETYLSITESPYKNLALEVLQSLMTPATAEPTSGSADEE